MRTLMTNNDILRLHDKIDDLTDSVNELKVIVAKLPCERDNLRIKILEKIVYGGVAIILVSFLIFLTGDQNKSKASANIKKTKIEAGI